MALRVLVMLIAMVSADLLGAAEARQLALAGHRPHFVRPGTPTKAKAIVEVRNAAVLYRAVSLELAEASLEEALAELGRHAGVRIAYNAEKLPKRKRISLSADRIEVAAALTQILFESGLDVAVARNGQLAVVECSHLTAAVAVVQDSGTIVGRVTDKATGSPLAGATVVVEGTRLSTTTSGDGQYRVTEIDPGTYAVRARYIGYATVSSLVTVGAGAEVTVDFGLEKSVQRLDEVVTTGTVVPTEVRALPTPVTVVNEFEIQAQRPSTLPDLFRQAVPGGVSWHVSQSPYGTSYSARGASTLSPGGGQMKVFIDGVEMANPGRAPVDPSSIQSIEVIRGPQAATIYGSEAIGGVVQIFTKRGSVDRSGPLIDAEAGLGLQQTPYDGFKSVLRQNYRLSARGSGADASYNVGAAYSRLGDYLPDGELSRQSNPSLYGGVRFNRGLLAVDVSGRYHTQNSPSVVNPQLLQSGFPGFTRPFFQTSHVQGQTLGGRIHVAPLSWWRNTLVVGFDRYVNDAAGTRPRLETPSDTFLFVFNESRTKAHVSFTTSVERAFAPNMSGSITAGVDHWSLPINQFFTSGASQATGGLGGTVSASRLITNNTGYFAQAQLAFAEALFLTTGLRAEQNTNLGDSLGTPVSPRVGLSYVRQLGTATFKLRGSYGRAIRAPSPGLKQGLVTPGSITLANPTLGPERQDGWDVGADAVFGSRGSLRVTFYDQTAESLIQFVQLGADPVLTFQNQNVGRVQNRGVEVEASLALGRVEVKSNYAYTRSRIEQLAPNYSGDLRIGDQSLATPRHTAGASLTLATSGGTLVAAGLTYVGSWNSYDIIALLSCFGGTGPCGDTSRDYIVSYPGFVKLNVNAFQQLTGRVTAFASVDNVTNNEAFELGNEFPVMGRSTMIGLQFRH